MQLIIAANLGVVRGRRTSYEHLATLAAGREIT